MEPLRFNGGCVIGADHVKAKKNCQDAFILVQRSDLTVAFVADGCGDSVDSPFSEVGSRLGVAIVANEVVSILERTARFRWNSLLCGGTAFWDKVQRHTLEILENISLGMGGDYRKNIVSHFMFTLVGVIITPETTVFSGVGDGYYFLNGEKYQLSSNTVDNMPAYLAYNLVETNLKKISPEDLILRPKTITSTDLVESFMIATDGLSGVLSNSSKFVPGTTEEVGGPEQFWNSKGFFDNEFSLGWRLNLLASEKRSIVWNEGRVQIHSPVVTDDLALVVGSRL